MCVKKTDEVIELNFVVMDDDVRDRVRPLLPMIHV